MAAKISNKDRNILTQLLFEEVNAAEYFRMDVAAALLNAGADPNKIVGPKKETAFIAAAKNVCCHPDSFPNDPAKKKLIKAFIDAGVKLRKKDGLGKTAFDYKQSKGFTQQVEATRNRPPKQSDIPIYYKMFYPPYRL
jgi:hypothetical protein